MTQQLVTRTIRQTERAALLDSWVTNTPVKMLRKKKTPRIFVKTRHPYMLVD